MKNLLAYIFLISLFSISTSAQNNSSKIKPLKKWKLNAINFGIGANWNQFNSMSMDELMIFAKDPNQMQRDLKNFTEEATPFTAGVAAHINLSWSPLSYKNGTYRNDRELQLGIIIHSPKEAMVSFKNKDLDTSIVYCNLHTELSLETAYLFKGTWGKRKRFHWHWGGGMNAGFTFGNEMMLISGQYFEPGQHPSFQPSDEMQPESYEAKPVVYTRLFIPCGIHYQIRKRTLFGLNFTKGVGWQMIKNERTNYMKKSSAFILNMKYFLK